MATRTKKKEKNPVSVAVEKTVAPVEVAVQGVEAPPAPDPSAANNGKPADAGGARQQLLNKADYALLRERVALKPGLVSQVCGALGNTLRLEAEGAIPEGERLKRNDDGTIALDEAICLVERWEEKNGGVGCVAPLFTAEADSFYKRNSLWQMFRDFAEVREVVGKAWGITLQELEAAVTKLREAEEAYQKKLDPKPDGEGECRLCRKKVRHRTVAALRRGEPVTDEETGKPKRRGDFRAIKTAEGLVPAGYCPRCKRQLFDEGKKRGVFVEFYPREDVLAYIERQKARVEKKQAWDRQAEEDIFAEAVRERDRRVRRGGNAFGTHGGPGRRPDRRAEKRGRSANWADHQASEAEE